MRGPTFITLDLMEAHLAKMALDREISMLEPRLSDPRIADIEGLPELVDNFKRIRDRIGKKLQVRLGREVVRL